METSMLKTLANKHLWVPNTMSCDLGMFMDQPAQPVAALQARVGRWRGRGKWSEWCCLVHCAVGRMVVEVRHVLVQQVFEVVAVDDQYPVE
jgi:hypothetical protein